MSQFDSVSITKQANVYFDGAVTSRSIEFANGETKTLGIMMPGDYEFNTGKKEAMEMLAGVAEVQLAGEDHRTIYKAGETFYVPAKSSFKITVTELMDYCCSFIDE